MGRLTTAFLSRKDVRSVTCSLNPLNLFTSAVFPKNRFAFYIFSLSYYITTIVHAMRLKVVNVGMLKAKYIAMLTITSSGDRRKMYFVIQSDGIV